MPTIAMGAEGTEKDREETVKQAKEILGLVYGKKAENIKFVGIKVQEADIYF